MDYSQWTDVSDPDDKCGLIDSDTVEFISTHMQTLDDVDMLVQDYPIVLIGESTHGTAEFYDYRCKLRQSLIELGLCKGVCIEGDWPDVSMMHMFVMNLTPLTLDEVMNTTFDRFPRWMWRNTSIHAFVTWLREWNDQRPPVEKCGLFGLDLYSLNTSMNAVIDYLSKTNPEGAEMVREYYACFDQFGGDGQAYGAYHARRHILDHPKCQAAAEKAVDQINAIRQQHTPKTVDGIDREDLSFINEVNAQVVVDAERYYRAMFDPKISSWDVRDMHFFNTLERIRSHLLRTRGVNNVVVWAHNSHIGDARHTQKGSRYKELNIGQLVKEKYPHESIIVGQLTHQGSVTAASEWGDNAKTFQLKKALPSSWEGLLHYITEKTGTNCYALDFRVKDFRKHLDKTIGLCTERAVGVVYCPHTELQSHYFVADLSRQFDICVYFDITNALVAVNTTEGVSNAPAVRVSLKGKAKEREDIIRDGIKEE